MYLTIDGGTTNTRVYSVSDGKILKCIKGEIGIGSRSRLCEFLKDALSSLCPDRNAKIIASGMITSAYGLCEVEHISAPAGIKELHEGMREMLIPEICGDIPIAFIPGVKIDSTDIEHADVMRGEETELFGLVEELDKICAYILPGTHSKCISTDDSGRISDFFTMSDGELLAAVKCGTVIGKSLDFFDDADEEYLSAGFELCERHGINEALFKCRIMDTQLKLGRREIYSFCLGVILCGEIKRISMVKADKFIFGGKKALRIPEKYLLEKYYGKKAVCLPDFVCDSASAMGAVRIYKYEENENGKALFL